MHTKLNYYANGYNGEKKKCDFYVSYFIDAINYKVLGAHS